MPDSEEESCWTRVYHLLHARPPAQPEAATFALYSARLFPFLSFWARCWLPPPSPQLPGKGMPAGPRYLSKTTRGGTLKRFFVTLKRPPRSTPFLYTTRFRAAPGPTG